MIFVFIIVILMQNAPKFETWVSKELPLVTIFGTNLPGTDSQDLDKVPNYMNETFSHPVDKKAHLSERTTIVTPSVKHTLSKWKSLDATKRHYCYLFLPIKKGFVYQRRYPCSRCDCCKS